MAGKATRAVADRSDARPDQVWDHPRMDENLDASVRHHGSFAGELMKGRLEAEGVEVLLKGEIEGPYPSGPVYLWVAAADETRARAVIDAVESGAFAVDEATFDEAAEDAEPPARLALRVLGRLAGLLQAVLAPLLLTRVAHEVALGLQLRTELGIDVDQRAGDAQTDRAGLAAMPPPLIEAITS